MVIEMVAVIVAVGITARVNAQTNTNCFLPVTHRLACSVARPPAAQSSLVTAARAPRTPTINAPEGLATIILAVIAPVNSFLTSARRAFSISRALAAPAAALVACSASCRMASSRGASSRDDRRWSREYAAHVDRGSGFCVRVGVRYVGGGCGAGGGGQGCSSLALPMPRRPRYALDTITVGRGGCCEAIAVTREIIVRALSIRRGGT